MYKNDIDGARSRTSDPDRARDRFFIKFITLIRNHDLDVLRTKAKNDSVNGKMVNKVIRTLNAPMAVGSGDWKLTGFRAVS